MRTDYNRYAELLLHLHPPHHLHGRNKRTEAPGQKSSIVVKPWRNLGELAGITLALHGLAVRRCGSAGRGDAGVAGQSGHGRVADEGVQAMFVSGQDSNGF